MAGIGPNDHHFAKNPTTGALEQKPGLGEFEPSERERRDAAAANEEHRLREEALARAAADIRNEALAMELRETEMNAREARIAAREAELSAGSSDAPSPEVESKRRTTAAARE